MNENALREEIAAIGKSLYDRGLAHGSAGNISVKLADGWLMTPTSSCLAARPERIRGSTRTASDYRATSRRRKPPHTRCTRRAAAGRCEPQFGARGAVSCMDGLDARTFSEVPAYRSSRAACAVRIPARRRIARRRCAPSGQAHAVLLANHGPVPAAKPDAASRIGSSSRREVTLWLRGTRGAT